MADPEKFINWVTNQPTAITNAVNSTFGPSGANHSVGLVPDPGAVSGTTKFLREDATWHAPPSQFPTATRAGDVIYWNGSSWVTLAGNNSGNVILNESNTGVPSWVAFPLGVNAGDIVYFNGTNYVILTGNSTGTKILQETSAGAPSWVVPPLALLNTLTASNSATLSDTTSLTSSYSTYIVVMTDIIPVTNAVLFGLQVSTNGGVSYISTTYVNAVFSWASGGSNTSGGTTSVNLQGQANTLDNTASFGLSGVFYIHNPSGGSNRTHFEGKSMYLNAASLVSSTFAGYQNSGNTAINAIQFLMSSGNISSGTIKIYGLV